MSNEKNPEAATSGLSENMDDVTVSGTQSTTPDASSATPETASEQPVQHFSAEAERAALALGCAVEDLEAELADLPDTEDVETVEEPSVAEVNADAVQVSTPTRSPIAAAMMDDDRALCDVVQMTVATGLDRFAALAVADKKKPDAERIKHRRDLMREIFREMLDVCVAGHSGYAWGDAQCEAAWQEGRGADEPSYADTVAGIEDEVVATLGVTTWSPASPHYCRGISDSAVTGESRQQDMITDAIQQHPRTIPKIMDNLDAIALNCKTKDLTKAKAKEAKERAEAAKERGETPPRICANNRANRMIIFANHPDLRHIYFDRAIGAAQWDKAPSWRNPLDRSKSSYLDVTDTDLYFMEDAMAEFIDDITEGQVMKVLKLYAGHPKRQTDPFLDHLDHLKWDGKARIERAITTVKDTPYTRATQKNYWLAMIQRSLEPGCQLDSMMVLVGKQGVRKTSFFRAITAGIPRVDGYYEMTSLPSGMNAADLHMQRHQARIVNIDEIDQLSGKHDQKALKQDITGRKDVFRRPYARIGERLDRSFIMVGTTNDMQFLTDETGGRRYWPLVVDARIPAEELTRAYMDQCLAEALVRYRKGERARYDQDFEDMANAYRATMTYNPVADAVDEWMENPRFEGRSVDVNVLTIRDIVKGLKEVITPSEANMSRRDFEQKVRTRMDSRSDYEFKTSHRIPGQKNPRKNCWVATEHKETPGPCADFGIPNTPQPASPSIPASGTVTSDNIITRGDGRGGATPDSLPAPVAPKPKLNTVEYDG